MARYKNFEKLLQCAAEAYVNEEVKQYKNADVSDIVISEKLTNKINGMIRKATAAEAVFHTTTKAAGIILAVSLAAFTATMSIPAVRSLFIQFIEEHFSDHIEISYQSSDTEYNSMIDTVIIPYVPENWNINILHDTLVVFTCELTGTTNENIVYTQKVRSSQSNSLYIDNDPTSTETVYLGSTPATLYTYPDGTQILLWLDRYTFTMVAENTPRETLLALAASVSPQ